MRAAVAWVDFGTASVSAFGTLAALIAKRETGRGQKVEAALRSECYNLRAYENLLPNPEGKYEAA
jgi:crotonobetainyl-CoA:carnitine CoA-transferase CaiB-like acyl-CoA transferase